AKNLTKELEWEYQLRMEEMAAMGKPVTGRQLVWIVLKSTESTEADAFITSYENMMEMQWYGDAMYQIVEFYYEWLRMKKNMAKNICNETLRNILYGKLEKHSKAFNDDLAHYLRAKDKSTLDHSDPDYSLEYLERCLYRWVIKSKETKVKRDAKFALKKGRKLQGRGWKNQGAGEDDDEEYAMPAQEKGGGKGGGKNRVAPKPKAKGKAKSDKEEQEKQLEKRVRPKAEMDKFCYWYQHGKCRNSDAECPKNHQLLKKHEIEVLTPPGKGGGKGKKGKGKSSARSRSTGKTKGESNGLRQRV
ncbi:MAG: hypothetical protein QF745_07055, partial [Planctomycetota bacterium]|nr:hypothetical protein [Planctomycetota bacterium]